MASNIAPARPSRVTIAQFSTLAFLPKTDDESQKWYTGPEKDRIRQDLMADVRRMSQAINASPPEAITANHLYECLGVELFVTPGLAARVVEAKQRHVEAILREQAVQRQQGACDIEKLSGLSRTSSQGTTERARRLAVGYHNLP